MENRFDFCSQFLKKLGWLYRQLSYRALLLLPRRKRFAVLRNRVRCDLAPSDKLQLKVAETQEELEACFKLLHDAYVQAGFMQPHPSGLRATLYHALPTTTTLLAKYDGRVVATVSLIRDSELGFPMQKIFDLKKIRSAGGKIVEVSALAVHHKFQATGGAILFPLLKFLHEYATRFFDAKHLVIAVNPRHISFYESILLFSRLKQNPVAHYDFVNGAPAVGAHLDLKRLPELSKRYYDGKEPAKNLYRYFMHLSMPNIVFPDKRFFTTNDPVMTPELLDYFFNQRTQVFGHASDEEKRVLHSIYDLAPYQAILPPLPAQNGKDRRASQHRHQRFSVSCPAQLQVGTGSAQRIFKMKVVECWLLGFRAWSDTPLPLEVASEAQIELGRSDHSRLPVRVMHRSGSDSRMFVLRVEEPDLFWRKFVSALRKASTHGDLGYATRYLE